MASILCVTEGLPSVLYASVELARRLAADGHRVVVAAPDEARPLVEPLGLELQPLEASRYTDFLASDAATGPLGRLLDLPDRRRRARASLSLDGFARNLEAARPDLVLVNGEMHEHVLTAIGSGVPVALLNFFVSIWRRPGLPPPHHLARPGVGWRGSRLGTELLWLELRVRKWGRAWKQRVRRVGCDRLALLRLLAGEYGVELDRETDPGQWLIPFTWRRLPVLSLHALEFEFPHQPRAGVHYVGPMVLESRGDRSPAPEERARLEALLAGSRRGGGDRTLIYAGFGSTLATDRTYLRSLLGLVEERPDWDLLLSLSGRLRVSELDALPERVHVFDWVPQLAALRHADVAVTHGGINTIDECVLHGVPMLVNCGFETDMAGNASRVVHHGLGIVGDRHDTGETLRGHVDRLLGEPSFRHSVRRFRDIYSAYATDRVAERVVEGLLKGGGAR